jgi:hypothetical protein
VDLNTFVKRFEEKDESELKPLFVTTGDPPLKEFPDIESSLKGSCLSCDAGRD